MTAPIDVSDQPHVLREYALLADGERGALIGPRGDIAWLCAPRWDDDAVFSALIGGRGTFAITPRHRFVWGGYYEDGGLIWRSRWVTTEGITECREALAFPGDPQRVVLMRRLLAVRGDAHTDLTFSPAAGFGHDGLKHLTRDDSGCWHGFAGDLQVRLQGAPDAAASRSPDGTPTLHTQLHLPEGSHHDIILELSRTPAHARLPDAAALWRSTEESWRSAVPPLSASLAVRDTRHSYAVLRGMTSAGGGMVAAATMSLPERAAQGRNYDYRYVWIRDQCYAGQAAAVDDAHGLLDDAVRFVAERLIEDGPGLRPAYTIDGGAVPDERSLKLSGYPGGTDIVGNHANSQFQLDAFGESLLLFAAAARHDHLDGSGYRAVEMAIAAITARWREPDAGIWELDNHRWTHSRLTCVAGLRAIADYASRRDSITCSELADAIMADAADSVHSSGRWQRAPDDPRVDAALLVPAIRGALPADDPRSVATLQSVAADLEQDCYVYRFRHDDRPLPDAEGAFLLTGFWMALAHHQRGDAVSAVRYFERNRAACGPPGLFCEEYDVVQRQLRGNLPQAFVHALQMESSLRLADSACAQRPRTATGDTNRSGRDCA
ncbi:glycoside hydrolase [Mycolicibacterium cyprinidarum]|uniref:Glycoside hydrolase n=1 Tax=Mycolicibacterium cyprinidarum TaxID=2860311 RepID=A0ABQ4VDF6_9MYCO|nr:glycoside hydrolase [Mycolicibacterium sp. NGTWS0302]GJF20160.1 glycoside hydrolase [Mycolicibacterium sp. NGTWSNA01]